MSEWMHRYWNYFHVKFWCYKEILLGYYYGEPDHVKMYKTFLQDLRKHKPWISR